MGIDVYMRWTDMDAMDHEAQHTGFRMAGEAGYLREAYHGAPYATAELISEDWGTQSYCPTLETTGDCEDPCVCGFEIPHEELLRRLPATCKVARLREKVVYGREKDPSVIAVTDGKSVDVVLAERIPAMFGSGGLIAQAVNQSPAPEDLPDVGPPETGPDPATAYIEFVELHGRLEKEGRRPRIYVSY